MPTSKPNSAQGPRLSFDPTIQHRKREARVRAQKTEVVRIEGAIAVMNAAEAFIRSINDTVARIALTHTALDLASFRRIEGGRGRTFIPLGFEADGSVTYRRARHTRALATFTTIERKKFVKVVEARPGASQALIARKARKLFAREMRAAMRRDIGAAP